MNIDKVFMVTRLRIIEMFHEIDDPICFFFTEEGAKKFVRDQNNLLKGYDTQYPFNYEVLDRGENK